MNLLKRSILLGLVCAMASAVQAGDLISKLPKTTKVLAKINLDRLRKSQFYANIEQENLAKLDQAQNKIAEQVGIDPKSISSVWLAGVKKNEGMLIIEGQFEADTIREAMSNKPECQIIDRAGCELAAYCEKKNGSGKNLAVIIDKTTMAIGEPAFVDAFIASFKGTNVLAGDKVEKAKAALAKDVLFQGILLEMPGGQKNPLVGAITDGNATLDVTDKITCTADITLSNEEKAKTATMMLNGLIAMYEMKQPQNYKGEIVKESILKNLNIEQNGNKININGGLDAEVLEQLIRKIN